VTSANIKSVAADSNVLLSAIAGRAAKRVFQKSDLVVITTQANIAEVEEYMPEFAERYDIEEEALLEVLRLLPVEIYSEKDYISHVKEARKILGGRDDDDIGLAALALKLEIPIWSNDDDFEDYPHKVFTTAQLIKILGV